MKQFGKGHRRLLSMLLSLVLLVGLVPVIGLPASAANDNINNISISNPDFYSDGSLKSISISYNVVNAENAGNLQGAAYGKFVVHNGRSTKTYSWSSPYAVGAVFDLNENNIVWPTLNTGVDPTIVAVDDGSFRWTEGIGGSKNRTAEFGEGLVQPDTEYYLYMWSLTKSYGVAGAYPDCFFAKIKIEDGELLVRYDIDAQFAPLTPAHVWNSTPVTTGNGTKQAATTLTCSCSAQVRVSLTASDVTLPGNAFSAKIDVEELQEPIVATYALRAATQLPAGHELTVSDTPGYKYSPDGTNFTDIDPASFTPAPGFYQASILVKDAASGNQLENLYVTYTVSDPAVTAETGDSRPIELLVMGMAIFSALAIAAFALDSRRRSSR